MEWSHPANARGEGWQRAETDANPPPLSKNGDRTRTLQRPRWRWSLPWQRQSGSALARSCLRSPERSSDTRAKRERERESRGPAEEVRWSHNGRLDRKKKNKKNKTSARFFAHRTAMPPQRVFALPRQQSLLLPAVINPFVQDTKLSRATIIKVSMAFKFSAHVNASLWRI